MLDAICIRRRCRGLHYYSLMGLCLLIRRLWVRLVDSVDKRADESCWQDHKDYGTIKPVQWLIQNYRTGFPPVLWLIRFKQSGSAVRRGPLSLITHKQRHWATAAAPVAASITLIARWCMTNWLLEGERLSHRISLESTRWTVLLLLCVGNIFTAINLADWLLSLASYCHAISYQTTTRSKTAAKTPFKVHCWPMDMRASTEATKN